MPRPGDDDRDDIPLYAVEVVPTDGAEVPRPKDHAAELLPEDGGETPCQLDGFPLLSYVVLLMLCAAMFALGKSVGTDWAVR